MMWSSTASTTLDFDDGDDPTTTETIDVPVDSDGEIYVTHAGVSGTIDLDGPDDNNTAEVRVLIRGLTDYGARWVVDTTTQDNIFEPVAFGFSNLLNITEYLRGDESCQVEIDIEVDPNVVVDGDQTVEIDVGVFGREING